jgi:hypothetical protein
VELLYLLSQLFSYLEPQEKFGIEIFLEALYFHLLARMRPGREGRLIAGFRRLFKEINLGFFQSQKSDIL